MEWYKEGSQNKEIAGFDADLSKAIAAKWGVDVKWVEMIGIDGLIPALQSGRCDAVISGLYASDKRKAVADAIEYLRTGVGLNCSTRVADQISKPEDLAGKTVSVQFGGVNEEVLRALADKLKAQGLPEVKIDSYQATVNVVLAVLNGKADCLVDTDVGLPNMVDSNPGQLKIINDIFESPYSFAIYVPKGSAITAATQATVNQLRDDGTLKQIAESYGLNVDNLNVENK
jgi:polar amino acid transport system substrate-binding protein